MSDVSKQKKEEKNKQEPEEQLLLESEISEQMVLEHPTIKS